MAPTLDDVASIKDLVNQLQVRVEQMERNIRAGGQGAPAEQLRMILMGPPGAGKWRFYFLRIVPARRTLSTLLWYVIGMYSWHSGWLQARELRRPKSRISFAYATWYVLLGPNIYNWQILM